MRSRDFDPAVQYLHGPSGPPKDVDPQAELLQRLQAERIAANREYEEQWDRDPYSDETAAAKARLADVITAMEFSDGSFIEPGRMDDQVGSPEPEANRLTRVVEAGKTLGAVAAFGYHTIVGR